MQNDSHLLGHSGERRQASSGGGSRVPGRVLYVVRRFPVRSQTFVANEVLDHLEHGLDVRIISIQSREAADFPVEELDPRFKDRVIYLDAGKSAASLLLAAANKAVRAPRHFRNLRRAVAVSDGQTRYNRALVTFLAAKLERRLREAAVVHCHFGDVGELMAMVLEAAASDARLVTTFHAFEITLAKFQPLSRHYRWVLARADLILTVNGIWRDRLIAAGGDPAKIMVHHMGVDTNALGPTVDSGRSDPKQLVSICMAGRMVEKKGHETALRALSALLAKSPELEVRLDLIGDGPLLDSLKALALELGLQQHIRFLGSMSHADTLRHIAQSDIFLLPSQTGADGDMEGIPVVLMEAMASAVPVVSTTHSGIPELVRSGIDGFLAPERDASLLGDILGKLAGDADLRRELGLSGRTRVLDQFDRAALGKDLRQLYANLSEAAH